MVKAYFYTDIPGSGKGWVLCVFATSRKDADEYIRNVNRGGRCIGKQTSGNLNAHCGATTDNARLEWFKRSD